MKLKDVKSAGQTLVFANNKTVKVSDKGIVETDDKEIANALKVVGFKSLVFKKKPTETEIAGKAAQAAAEAVGKLTKSTKKTADKKPSNPKKG